MARVLIVGCGCRGRELAGELARQGHQVRGTTRDPAKLAAIEAAGIEPALADPDRLGTLLTHLQGVSVVCWLMGTADGADPLHGDRLRSLLEKLVDTPVRGFVYEAAGTVEPALLAAGAAAVREAGERWAMPVAVADDPPAMAAAVARILSAPPG